jgi:4-hydroxy-tetrahydrodipicolinate reductase
MPGNVKAVVAGAAGRMGQKVIKAIVETGGIELVGALECLGHKAIDKDAGIIAGVGELGIKLMPSAATDDSFSYLFSYADVVINFTSPEGAETIVNTCIVYRKPLIIGTTSLPAKAKDYIDTLSNMAPVVEAPNMSIGANTIFVLLPKIIQTIGKTFTDFNIIEVHHTEKKDAPSGTAKRMAEIIAKEKGWDVCYELKGKKQPDAVYVVAVRSGDTKGEHHVLIANKSEKIEIIHTVSTRDAFANGAVAAAIFATSAEKGLYDMGDVIESQENQYFHSATLR